MLAVLVTAANVHDTTGGKLLLDDLAAAHPSVTKVWADGGYQTSIFNHGAGLGIDVEVVQRPRARGFEPLGRRHPPVENGYDKTENPFRNACGRRNSAERVTVSWPPRSSSYREARPGGRAGRRPPRTGGGVLRWMPDGSSTRP